MKFYKFILDEDKIIRHLIPSLEPFNFLFYYDLKDALKKFI